MGDAKTRFSIFGRACDNGPSVKLLGKIRGDRRTGAYPWRKFLLDRASVLQNYTREISSGAPRSLPNL
jgi:hypothetical protein